MSFFIIFLLVLLSVKNAQGSGGCRTLDFLDCIKNKAFVNHTIETFIVPFPGLELCQHKCFMNGACVSYNLGPTRGSTRRCELSDTDHVGYPDHVVTNEGFEYCAVKNPCLSSSCAKYQICKPDFSWDSYTCFDRCALMNPCPPYRNCIEDPSSLMSVSCSGLTTSCSAALGMEDGRIQDDAITASSVFRSGTHDSFRGRLNNNYDDGTQMYAWSAKVNQAGEYLQVDLGRVFYVTKVATQGREYPNTKFVQWIKTYSLQYGLDGVTWDDYMTGGARKVFNGNTDTTSVVTHILAVPIKARFVRIVVESWNQHISMRAELYGCQV